MDSPSVQHEGGLTIGQIIRDPDLPGVIATILLASIGAVQVPSKRVVGPVLLDDDLNGRIVGPG